ncbi:MAG TPA: hypothetical protein VLA52_01850 [Thermohalobaculum sp.]|nr:hypothetical protein [Thermohalobaculum sp.]
MDHVAPAREGVGLVSTEISRDLGVSIADARASRLRELLEQAGPVIDAADGLTPISVGQWRQRRHAA